MERPAHQDIARRAYEMWERDGWVHGRDLEHWFTAERQLIGAATAREDQPIGEIRRAEQGSAAALKMAKQPVAAPAPRPAAVTAAEDRPIGEIRAAGQTAVQPAAKKPAQKQTKSEAAGKSAKAPRGLSSTELGAKLDALQSTLAAKDAAAAKKGAKSRAKKPAAGANGAAPGSKSGAS